MTPTLRDLLERAAGAANREFDLTPLLRRADRRRRQRARRRAVLSVASVIVVAIVVALVPSAARDDGEEDDLATVNMTTTRFDAGDGPERTMFVIDDGYDGVLVVDPITHIAVRARLDGQRAGDQPNRLLLVGDHVVVGRGEIFVSSLAGGPSRKLGDATIAIPAEQPNRVWLVDYPDGRIGSGTPTLRLADLEGRVEMEIEGLAPGVGLPVAGAIGGVVHETANGLAVWNPQTRTITRSLGSSSAHVLSSGGGAIAWCETTCETLRLSREGRADTVFTGFGHYFSAAQFSPDGRRLATVRQLGGACCPSRTPALADIAIIDAIGGVSIGGFQASSAVDALAWTPDGDAVIATGDGPNATTVQHFSLKGSGPIQSTIPFPNVKTFVTVSTAQHPYLSAARFTTPERCTEAHIHSADRATPCSFGFP